MQALGMVSLVWEGGVRGLMMMMMIEPGLRSIIEVVKGSSDAPIPDYVESIYW